MLLKVYGDDPKLADIYQNYKKNRYKQAIEDYFKSSPASVLDEEKVCQKYVQLYCIRALYALNSFTLYQGFIDKTLTEKTGKAIRNCTDDLLPNGQVDSKKPRLTESVNSSILISADSKINKVDNITDSPNERNGNTLVLYLSYFKHRFNMHVYNR